MSLRLFSNAFQQSLSEMLRQLAKCVRGHNRTLVAAPASAEVGHPHRQLDRVRRRAEHVVTDYEGISGYEQYRDDLVIMFFPTLDARTGELISLKMTPLRMRRMQLGQPTTAEREWLGERLGTVSGTFGCDVELDVDGNLIARGRIGSRA